jgi:hypothetical protein
VQGKAWRHRNPLFVPLCPIRHVVVVTSIGDTDHGGLDASQLSFHLGMGSGKARSVSQAPRGFDAPARAGRKGFVDCRCPPLPKEACRYAFWIPLS